MHSYPMPPDAAYPGRSFPDRLNAFPNAGVPVFPDPEAVIAGKSDIFADFGTIVIEKWHNCQRLLRFTVYFK